MPARAVLKTLTQGFLQHLVFMQSFRTLCKALNVTRMVGQRLRILHSRAQLRLHLLTVS